MLPAASVTASAASGAASAAATGLQAGAGIAGLLYQIYVLFIINGQHTCTAVMEDQLPAGRLALRCLDLSYFNFEDTPVKDIFL